MKFINSSCSKENIADAKEKMRLENNEDICLAQQKYINKACGIGTIEDEFIIDANLESEEVTENNRNAEIVKPEL